MKVAVVYLVRQGEGGVINLFDSYLGDRKKISGETDGGRGA